MIWLMLFHVVLRKKKSVQTLTVTDSRVECLELFVPTLFPGFSFLIIKTEGGIKFQKSPGIRATIGLRANRIGQTDGHSIPRIHFTQQTAVAWARLQQTFLGLTDFTEVIPKLSPSVH